MSGKKPCYVWDEKLIEDSDRLPAVIGRASMVHDLIEAYNLLDPVTVVRSSPAIYEDMKAFHSELYLDHLKKFTEVDDDYMTSAQDEEYGIGYDCPPVCNMFELVSSIAGGSITAAKCLLLDIANVAINWCGGWHHAHRFGAEGFCYVNDIVIAIEMLRKKFFKVLYVDLDVHHGNGVQDAYKESKSVFTLSFHKYEPGFYPGTGGIDDIGDNGGTGYTCNVPLQACYSDDTMEYAFEKIFNSVYNHFSPDAIVTQCGADALARDPHGGANLTVRSYRRCVRNVLDKRKPTLLLGGGGYNHSNTARLWASLTALVTGVDLDEQIPEHTHWPQYGPDYTISVEPTLAKDTNKKSVIEEFVHKINGNLAKYIETSQAMPPVAKRLKTGMPCANQDVPLNERHKEQCYKKINNTVQKEKNIASEQLHTNKEDNPLNVIDIYEFVE